MSRSPNSRRRSSLGCVTLAPSWSSGSTPRRTRQSSPYLDPDPPRLVDQRARVVPAPSEPRDLTFGEQRIGLALPVADSPELQALGEQRFRGVTPALRHFGPGQE